MPVPPSNLFCVFIDWGVGFWPGTGILPVPQTNLLVVFVVGSRGWASSPPLPIFQKLKL
ncbi:hypothetical protein QUB28_01495 [Microcoleus sp. B4-C3]|uniref:hypothetical protein n=1 Tax=Microcoleus sp. B4-C2 TaxID=2818661 RepID=UPI002FD5FBAB